METFLWSPHLVEYGLLDDDVKMDFGVHQLVEFSFSFIFLSIY